MSNNTRVPLENLVQAMRSVGDFNEAWLQGLKRPEPTFKRAGWFWLKKERIEKSVRGALGCGGVLVNFDYSSDGKVGNELYLAYLESSYVSNFYETSGGVWERAGERVAGFHDVNFTSTRFTQHIVELGELPIVVGNLNEAYKDYEGRVGEAVDAMSRR